MRTLARAALVLLALAPAGCTGAQTSSSSKFEGERKAVADVVEELQTASQSRKAGQICSDILSRRLAASFKASGGDCVREVDRSVRDADDTELEVRAVTITGATARAQVKGLVSGRDGVSTLGLVREDAKWRVDDLG
jgi:hypothetical protein